mmetsp:Transcript_132945/g.425190  ORF Transcript_132945/g.425190 Transcript_132945/m.425190 type:complete len:366 (-) Transcript_132945:361-1458(-)
MGKGVSSDSVSLRWLPRRLRRRGSKGREDGRSAPCQRRGPLHQRGRAHREVRARGHSPRQWHNRPRLPHARWPHHGAGAGDGRRRARGRAPRQDGARADIRGGGRRRGRRRDRGPGQEVRDAGLRQRRAPGAGARARARCRQRGHAGAHAVGRVGGLGRGGPLGPEGGHRHGAGQERRGVRDRGRHKWPSGSGHQPRRRGRRAAVPLGGGAAFGGVQHVPRRLRRGGRRCDPGKRTRFATNNRSRPRPTGPRRGPQLQGRLVLPRKHRSLHQRCHTRDASRRHEGRRKHWRGYNGRRRRTGSRLKCRLRHAARVAQIARGGGHCRRRGHDGGGATSSPLRGHRDVPRRQIRGRPRRWRRPGGRGL